MVAVERSIGLLPALAVAGIVWTSWALVARHKWRRHE